ncbi:hypothetical protein PY64_01435, partial [Lacticaseibacillus rhamnosus]|uniref:hypothetical protein n=1 Tax=Lacticaseibacillus rhamnosus TaxID=47715 RepID=UPI0007DEACB2
VSRQWKKQVPKDKRCLLMPAFYKIIENRKPNLKSVIQTHKKTRSAFSKLRVFNLSHDHYQVTLTSLS